MKRLGLVLMVLGAVVVVLSAVGSLVAGGDDAEAASSPATDPTGSPAPAPSDSASPTETGSPTTSTTPVPLVDPQLFLDDLARALRRGDPSFLVARLHPAVLERYGEDQCGAALDDLQDPSAGFVVLSFEEASSWVWKLDGVRTRVPEVVDVRARVTLNGTTERREVHVGMVDGVYRWFTDCGEPLG